MSNVRCPQQQGGYALLVSVVVIATVLLMLATISARRVQDSFFSALGLQEMTQARALVEGCAQEALYRRSINSQYSGNETLQIMNGTCAIRPIIGQIVEIEAQSQERYYRVRFTLTADEPPYVSTWERVESF